MIASHTIVSSSLTTLPAFETEHTLYLAEQNLVQRPRKSIQNDSGDNGPQKQSIFAHSAALQTLADAYVNRRAGDRGDNLVRAAALSARAASFPATNDDEKYARAAALSRLGRALLARSQLDLRFTHDIDININVNVDHPGIEDDEKEIDHGDREEGAAIKQQQEHKTKDTTGSNGKKGYPDVPRFLQLAQSPNANVSRVAQKSLLATTAAVDALAASTPHFAKLKAAFEQAEDAAAASVDGIEPVPPTGPVLSLADLGPEFTALRNTLAALHVDRARALIFGGASPGTLKDATVPKRVKEAMNALKLASKLRVPSNRRQKAAAALSDIMLATLYSRTRGKSNGGKDNLEEGDRVRAARLFRSAKATLASVFGGDDSNSNSNSNTSTSESDRSTPCASPPVSPVKPSATDKAKSEEIIDEATHNNNYSTNGKATTNTNMSSNNNKENEQEEEKRKRGKIAAQDPFEPFVEWDLDEVRKLVDAEIMRLGPVMQQGEGRRSCILF